MGPAALLLKEDCAHIDQVAWNMTPRNAVVTVSKLDFQLVLMPPSGQKKKRTNAALNSLSVIINNDSLSWPSHYYKVTSELL